MVMEATLQGSVRLIRSRGFIIYLLALIILGAQLAVLQEIHSCTDPDGSCAKRGQQQAAQMVGSLNLVSIVAAWCANETAPPASVAELQRCVQQQLAQLPPGSR